MPTYRDQPCCVCGKLVNKRVRGDRKVYCAQHAEEVMADAVRQINQGSGPIHDKWQRSRREGLIRQLAKMDEAGAP